MNEPKHHTPGPWYVKFGTEVCALDTRDGDDIVLAAAGKNSGMRSGTFTSLSHTSNEANARLMAAAPDLLDALKTMLAQSGTLEEYQRPSWEDEIACARRAIAKAEGRA